MFGLSSIGIGAGLSLPGAAGAVASGGFLLPALSTAAMFGEGIANNYWAYKNYQLQKGQYGYEQYLQSLLMGREDNAVQEEWRICAPLESIRYWPQDRERKPGR